MTGAAVALAGPAVFPSPAQPTGPKRLPVSAIPPNLNPYLVYLETLGSRNSKRTMAAALDRMAEIIAPSGQENATGSGAGLAWWHMRVADVAMIKGQLTEAGRAPAYINLHLSAFRKVLEMCWMLGLTDADAYQRASKVKNVKGSRLPTGRTVSPEEVAAMLQACLNDTDGTNWRPGMTDKHKAALKSLGLRDAALLATLASTGIRCAEAAGLTIENLDTAARRLKVIGKGNKQRPVFLDRIAVGYVNRWLAHAGLRTGPVFPALGRWGHARPGNMDPAGVARVYERRRADAHLRPTTTHDMRKSVATTLIPKTDLISVQKILGHASPVTTQQNYDLREEEGLLEATDMIGLLTAPEDLDAVVAAAASTAWPGAESR